MKPPKINITIPTYNRANSSLAQAVESALNQDYASYTVTVVDDGSSDDTALMMREYAGDQRFSYIRLGSNVGTAKAKNVGILCSRYDAITFHDSDDVSSLDKLSLQAKALDQTERRADHDLNWQSLNIDDSDDIEVDVVVGGYDLVKMNKEVHYINNRISLIDDFFPNLQFPTKTAGDWCLINPALFRRRVFEALGGYIDSIEEDRELRNRSIAAGFVYYFVDRPLLTKIEMSDSLTIGDQTGFGASRRLADRERVWQRNNLYRQGLLGKEVGERCCAIIDLAHVNIEEIINPHNLTYNDSIPASRATKEHFKRYGF